MSSREEDVLKALANPIGLKLFKLIATNTTSTDNSQVITSDFLNSQTKVTRKQFYSNMSRLVNKTGLILRKIGISSNDMPAEQMLEISARLIEDEDIRRIVFEPIMIDKPKKDVLYGPQYDQRRNKIEKRIKIS